MPEKASFAGLDGTQLKLIALVLMLLDHIHYMFVDFVPIPHWFTMLGRLVAPIFLFLLAEGFAHTRSRPRFFLRVWLMSFGMESVLFCMRVLGLWVRGDGFIPLNGIFMNFPILFCLWQGIDWIRTRRPALVAAGLAALVLPWLVPDLLQAIVNWFPGSALPVTYVGYAILPSWRFITDGGQVYLIEGLVWYWFRQDRKVQLLAGAVTMLGLEFFCYGFLFSQRYFDFTWAQMFTNVDYCQWMSVFSLALLALYNGQRGKGHGRLFYVFYPTHIYALYALSCVLYPVLG